MAEVAPSQARITSGIGAIRSAPVYQRLRPTLSISKAQMTAAMTPPTDVTNRKVERLAIKGGQPGDRTIGDQICGEPHGPDGQRALEVDALKQFAPV